MGRAVEGVRDDGAGADHEQDLGGTLGVGTAGLGQELGGLTADHIGTIAWQSHIPLYELAAQHASLEEAFMTLTQDSVEYRSTDNAAAVAA